MRKSLLLTCAFALSACGGGGGGSASGTLLLRNGGGTSRLGDCSQQWQVQSVETGETLFANTGKCGEFTFTLTPGLYNVTACAPAGACSASDCYQQTVDVSDESIVDVPVRCGGCSECS